MKLFVRLTAMLSVAALMITASGCCCTGLLPVGNLLEKPCEHDWAPATCQVLSTCTLCGETQGELAFHTFVGTSCSVCGEKLTLVTDPNDPAYYCVGVTGDYGDGIGLPMMENTKVTMMQSIDWSYLENNNNPDDPFAQYHATLLWREAYSAQGGDVEIITISDEQQTDYLATQMASGAAPDILPANYDLTYPHWSAKGFTEPVETYAAHLKLEEEGLYNRELMNAMFLYGGKSHAVITAQDVDRQYIVFNRTKFQQAGQSTPLDLWKDGKWTWSSFVKTAKAMTDAEKGEYGFTGWGLFPYFAPYPMATVDEMSGKITLTVEDNRYMRYMTEVYHLYQVDKAARCDWSLQDWASLFSAGNDAMVITNKAGYRHVVERSERLGGDSFGMAPVPAFDPTGETLGIASASAWGYSICAGGQNKIGAAEYIRLEALVSRNIAKAFDGNTWYDKHLTEDEKAMLEATANDPVCVETIRGVGDCCYGIIDAYIVPEMYYTDTKNPVQTIFDAQMTALEAEIAAYNASIQ